MLPAGIVEFWIIFAAIINLLQITNLPDSGSYLKVRIVYDKIFIWFDKEYENFGTVNPVAEREIDLGNELKTNHVKP